MFKLFEEQKKSNFPNLEFIKILLEYLFINTEKLVKKYLKNLKKFKQLHFDTSSNIFFGDLNKYYNTFAKINQAYFFNCNFKSIVIYSRVVKAAQLKFVIIFYFVISFAFFFNRALKEKTFNTPKCIRRTQAIKFLRAEKMLHRLNI